jgi:hydrogenase-4 component B
LAVLAVVRAVLLRRREVRSAATWGCGYEAPNPRMQYTAASFAAPTLEPFAVLLHGLRHEEKPTGYFPGRARHEVHYGDAAGERLLVPLLRRITRVLERFRVIHHGRLQLYLVYILVTLVALMAWQLIRTLSRP